MRSVSLPPILRPLLAALIFAVGWELAGGELGVFLWRWLFVLSANYYGAIVAAMLAVIAFCVWMVVRTSMGRKPNFWDAFIWVGWSCIAGYCISVIFLVKRLPSL